MNKDKDDNQIEKTSVLHILDLYKTEVKSFNFKGKNKVSSHAGITCSLVTFTIILALLVTGVLSTINRVKV